MTVVRVLDTSVAIAWYLHESFSGPARMWQKRMLDGAAEFLVPSLHFWEFGNVVRTYVRRGEIDADTGREIYAVHIEAPLALVEPDRASVLDTALRFDATVYDAVYAAISLEREVPLLTAESKTTPWIKKLGALADCIG